MKFSRKSRGLVSAISMVPITFAAFAFAYHGYFLQGLGVELVAGIVYGIWISLAEPDEPQE